MAEISSPGPPNPNPPASPVTSRPTPPGTKRLLLTFSVLVSFLLALPVLLRSTAIHRSPLPFRSIRALRRHPHLPPCRLHAVFLRPGPSSAARLSSLLAGEIRGVAAGAAAACGGCDWKDEVLVTLDRSGSCERSWESDGSESLWRCGAVDAGELGSGEDEEVDELLRATVGSSRGEGGEVYTVVVAAGRQGGEMRGVVGRYRHGWLVGGVSEEEAVARAAKMFAEVFVRGVKGNGEEGMEEFMPVGLDGSVTFSFSLLNADPRDWVFDWDFKMGKALLAPVVEALAPLADIRVESQVLYYTPKSSFSYWDEKLRSYIFSTGDLPFFVNSNEWHLDTSIVADGRSKVLQFVVYVPSAKECPLVLQLPNKDISMTNAFISPMWGGVIVWNPPTCTENVRHNHLSSEVISPQEFRELFQIVIGQLRSLFGFRSDNLHAAELGLSKMLGSEKGFTEWELDFLQRRHACTNLQSCAITLESLSNLVQSLPRMIVMDEIGKQVTLSLEAAALAHRDTSLGIYNNSAEFARRARALAEDAFFHPSISSLSYSSLEHYFAIYMPFFAPVSLHVLLAAVKEFRRYRQESAKYLAFVSRSTEAS